MDPTRPNYGRLAELALTDPETGFAEAVEAKDALGSAMVAALSERLAAPTRLPTVVKAHAGSFGVSETLLRLLELEEHLTDQLVTAVVELLVNPSNLPLDESQLQRAERIALSTEARDDFRRKALWWIWCTDQERGIRISRTVISDDSEAPTAEVKNRALRNLALVGDDEVRGVLERFALEQFEPHTDPERPAPVPEVAVKVLDELAKAENDDAMFAEEILAQCAKKDMALGSNITNLAKKVTRDKIKGIVGRLQKDEHVSWLNTHLLPPLIEDQPLEIARSISEGWWPAPCVDTLAKFPWETRDDMLHVDVLHGIHGLEDVDDAKVVIRHRVHQRCKATSSENVGEMPRVGVRAMLKLCLSGHVAPDDVDLVGSVSSLSGETFVTEVRRASWKKRERARRLGELLSHVHSERYVDVLSHALSVGSDTAVALAQGLDPEAIVDQANEVAVLAAGDEPTLLIMCERSTEIADLTLTRWEEDLSVSAFRALAGSAHADGRLEAIPKAAVAYDAISTAERTELLTEMGETPARLQLLLEILSHRTRPPNQKPRDHDIEAALEMIADHLAHGEDSGTVLSALRETCEEAINPAIRRSAYRAFSKAHPSSEVVEVLLAREGIEAPQVKDAVRDALTEVADVLNASAGDPSNPERGSALSLLSLVDRQRAAAHARDLLVSERADDRRTAARVLAESGNADQDGRALEQALEHEPKAEVQEEMKRAIRRLKVGDKAAAHETLLELVGLHDETEFLSIAPRPSTGSGRTN